MQNVICNMENMYKFSKISIIFIALLTPSISMACKEAILGEVYPIADFNKYDYIVIVKIDKSIHSDKYRYKPLVSFEATVIESIKGDLNEGAALSGKPKHEIPRAVCPVHLAENGIYLLLLSKENGEYAISRFNFHVKNDNKYFSNYISQIKNAIISE